MKKPKTWQEAFEEERIWPKVLGWNLYRFDAAFPPDRKSFTGVYNVSVVVADDSTFPHFLHVPMGADDTMIVDLLFRNRLKHRLKTVRDFFCNPCLVGLDEKPFHGISEV